MKRKAQALRAYDRDNVRQLEFPLPTKTGVKQIGLTQDRLRELLSYDPVTGVFARRNSRGGKKAGSIAGRLDSTGHRQICIDGRNYLAHRLVWLYVHGYWPRMQVDHRDCDKDNNCLSNLRLATNAQQRHNSRAKSGTASGVKGVTKRGNRWQARIIVGGKEISLGRRGTKEEAGDLYAKAALFHFGEFARAA